jgi:hypothetical protein
MSDSLAIAIEDWLRTLGIEGESPTCRLLPLASYFILPRFLSCLDHFLLYLATLDVLSGGGCQSE